MEVLISAISGFRISAFNPFNNKQHSSAANVFSLKHDTFECSNIVFLGSATSAGNPLKKLNNAPDPFFGKPMITSPNMTKILSKLDSCTTVKKAVNYLKKYKPYMQETELAIFERFESLAPNSPRTQFQDLLKFWYDDAIKNLKLEEFEVLDDIDKTSQSLTVDTQLNIRKQITNCRLQIFDNNPENTFKRKSLLTALDNIQIKDGEEKVFEEIIDKADCLPSSATSVNAFIVKYSDRSHEEIAKRIIRMSELTIDHLRAKARGGPNSLKNFVPASVKANSLKGSSLLEKFVKRFPQITENFQIYMEYIINLIHNGGLAGHQTYPYAINKTVFHESGGQIKLNLSNYRYSGKQARKLEKEYAERHKKMKKINGKNE